MIFKYWVKLVQFVLTVYGKKYVADHNLEFSMKVTDFESAVWELEGIRIVVRAPANGNVNGYPYKNAADENWNVTKWISGRIAPEVKGFEIIAIQGNGTPVHGATKLRKIRSGYSD